jgi:hypothetical protein
MKYFLMTFMGMLLVSASLFAQADFWPKEIPLKTGGKILIYQPQPDELNGNILKCRTAVGAKEKANDPMVYGAIFFDAQLNTDKSTRMATLQSLTITNAKMDGVKDLTKVDKMIALIESEIPKWDLDISLDQITATMKRNSGDGKCIIIRHPKCTIAISLLHLLSWTVSPK